jgi:8-oxo-dGTP pyrophosphatase MutT (NUDIX family)
MATSANPTTLYPSTTFLESAGTVLFKLSTRQICLVHYAQRSGWLLPKGRRDIGEDRSRTAVRETEEETGYKCRLLPVNMSTCQPRPGFEDSDGGAGRQDGICEPIMVVQRRLKDGKMKFVWWYVATIDEDAEVGEGEAEFESRLFGFEEAVGVLMFQDDREVVESAVEIFKETFGEA